MIRFEPVFTLGPIIVFIFMVVLFAVVILRQNRNLRGLVKQEVRLEVLEDQVNRLMTVILKNDGGQERGHDDSTDRE